MKLRGKVGAGLVDVLVSMAEVHYRIPRSELLYVAALEPEDLRNPGARVPNDAVAAIMFYLLEKTGDRGMGLRFAEATDLRTQGFWGYLFISALSLRQAVELLMRFQHLRHSSPMTLRVEGGWAYFDRERDPETPPELEVMVGDAFLASFCFHRRRWIPEARGEMRAWLQYPEEPHHRELRELVGGPVTFEAPFYRFCIPAWELDLSSRGADPHLYRLAKEQLEHQVEAAAEDTAKNDVVEEVRRILVNRLSDGPSIEGVASELRVSTRTLRRRLDALGVTFQRLLGEVRERYAIEYLTKTEDTTDRVAERLGYVDVSNFRRAFRRWTGLSPAEYRAANRAPVRSSSSRGPRAV